MEELFDLRHPILEGFMLRTQFGSHRKLFSSLFLKKNTKGTTRSEVNSYCLEHLIV